jgi:hypothetical protein
MAFKYHNRLQEFDKSTAHNGDIYLYEGDKLFYIGNTIIESIKPSLWQKIKYLLKRILTFL